MSSDSETKEYELIETDKDDHIEPATQIAVKRTPVKNEELLSYYHHGVHIGDNKVVHLSGENKTNSKPRKCDKDEFLCGENKLYQVKYHDSVKVLPAQETIRRANKAVEESARWRPYNAISNNCESFATSLKTGESKSVQANNVVAGVSSAFSKLSSWLSSKPKDNED